MYDVLIIGGWAAWLFSSIFMPKELKKAIIEKNENPWKKVILSGWERCNVSNIDIEPEEDYFWENTKAMYNILSKFSNYDLINWIEENWVKTKIEDNGRVILASESSKELLQLLVNKSQENNTELITFQDVQNITKEDNYFIVKTLTNEFKSKAVVVSTWGKSYHQVGTTWVGFDIAKKFWIEMTQPYKWLCWVETMEDLSELSWSTITLITQFIDNKKVIYDEKRSFLFTHWWVSGPAIFNWVIKLWEHLRKLWIKEAQETQYICDNIKLKLIFDLDNSTKRVNQFFDLDESNNSTILNIKKIRDRKEAKVTWGWVKISELNNHFESKKIPGLYFIGEVLDLTWKTWGYNLQLSWSTGYICGSSFKL